MFDTECLLRRSFEVMKSKLNDELLVVDADKGDYALDPINDDAWYFQNLSDEVWSYHAFVVWGLYVQPTQTATQSNNSMKQIQIFFEVCLPDDGGPIEENVFYKLLRYTRALESVIHKNYDKIRSGLKVQVQSLNPTSFDLGGKTFRSAGVLIQAAMSAS